MLGLIQTPLDWVGFGLSFFCFLMLLTIAFQKGRLWGISLLLFSPFSTLLLTLNYRREAGFWFVGMSIGIALMLLL